MRLFSSIQKIANSSTRTDFFAAFFRGKLSGFFVEQNFLIGQMEHFGALLVQICCPSSMSAEL